MVSKLLFTILVCLVAYSQQQRRRGKIQVIRNLDDNNDSSLVQRYEETPPIRPLKPAPRQSTTQRKKSRPINRNKSAAAPPPAPKVEKRKFNVLLNTQSGFQETGKKLSLSNHHHYYFNIFFHLIILTIKPLNCFGCIYL